jgi:translation initiation factor 3 subunit M
VLQVSRAEVEKWLKKWDIAPAEKSAFLKTLVNIFSKAGPSVVGHLYHHFDSLA